MNSDYILKLLRDAGEGYISGEAMSRELKISRAAVWKQISVLREKGYQIEAVSNRGYRLISEPEQFSRESILSALGNHEWADRLMFCDQIGSTNIKLKQLAEEGAPEGTVLIAAEQTQGRGRLGRTFLSPPGVGLYISALYRPKSSPEALAHITALAAVATCMAIQNTCSLKTGIKWPNDLVAGQKKLVGILTELSVEWETSHTEYLVIGIGINCNHNQEDFPEDLRSTATSIALCTGERVDRSVLAANLIRALSRIYPDAPQKNASWHDLYEQNCVNIGKRIQVIRAGKVRYGTALALDDDYGLIVRFDDGAEETVFSGEVSVRGLYGYTD